MNIWQGSKIKLRSFEPDDGDLFFEMISDTEIQRFVSDIRLPMSRKTAFDVTAELSEGKNTFLKSLGVASNILFLKYVIYELCFLL